MGEERRVFRKSKVFYLKLLSFLFVFLLGLQEVQAEENTIKINGIQDKFTGENVTVTGSTSTHDEVMVKVFKSNGELYFFSMAPRLSTGNYSASYKIPTNAPLGRYTVVAGYDNIVQTTTFNVKAASMKDIEAALNDIKITYASGDTWESVTQNFILPLTGSNGTTVAWTSNKPEFASANGEVGLITRPKATESDVTVTLTATVSKEGQTASRPFLVIVKKQGVVIENETTRKVDVVVGDGSSDTTPAEQVDITRKHLSNGTKVDKVVLDDETARKVVNNATSNNKTTAQIIIDDLPNDQADEVAVEISNTSINQLATTEMDLDIKTEEVTISLEKETLRDLRSEGIDLFFRVVPIRKTEEQQEIEDRTKNDEAVKEKAGGLQVEVLGKSMTIETNYKDHKTKLRFPLTGVTLPTDPSQLQQFLNSIHVFIEHSDGEKKVVIGTPIYENGSPIAVEIEIDKFSTFTLIQIDNPSSNDSSTSENEPKRTAKVVLADGKTANLFEQIPIVRNVLLVGTKIDHVLFNLEMAKRAVKEAVESKKNVVQVYIDQLMTDQADEITVDVQNTAVDQLVNHQLDLEIKTDDASLTLLTQTLEELQSDGKNLFFRMVPIRQDEEIKQAIQTYAGDQPVQVMGKPMIIETNYNNRLTKLRFPLTDSMIPTEFQQEGNADSLYVFAKHIDGEQKLVKGHPLFDKAGKLTALEITVDKFGTFAIVHVKDSETAGGYHERLILGYPDQTFRPSRLITRAEIASLIARIIPEVSEGERSEAKYPDVSSSFWAAKDIQKVKASHLMKGDQQGHFRPHDPVTRAEMAAIVVNWKQLNGASEAASFKDTKGHWANHAIQAVKLAGVMTGYPDGTFRPNRELTRAEAVVVLNQLLDRGPLKGMKTATWPDVPLDHWASADVEEASTNHHYAKERDGSEVLADR